MTTGCGGLGLGGDWAGRLAPGWTVNKWGGVLVDDVGVYVGVGVMVRVGLLVGVTVGVNVCVAVPVGVTGAGDGEV
jgi:hypothetical protein